MVARVKESRLLRSARRSTAAMSAVGSRKVRSRVHDEVPVRAARAAVLNDVGDDREALVEADGVPLLPTFPSLDSLFCPRRSPHSRAARTVSDRSGGVGVQMTQTVGEACGQAAVHRSIRSGVKPSPSACCSSLSDATSTPRTMAASRRSRAVDRGAL